jgi:hypothetical protein
MFIRSCAIGLLAAATIGSGAYAESYFACINTITAGSTLDLGTITADADGVVEVYDYHLGQQGDSMGKVDVHAGANPDVRVDVGMPPLGNVLAILTINGQAAATKVYDVCEKK